MRKIIQPRRTWEEAKDGAQFFGAEFLLPTDAEMYMHPERLVVIHLLETGLPCDGQRLLPTLSPLISEVAGIVDDFEARGFFS